MNIANPADLKRLVSLFPRQEVYVVAGSDVVANASAYRASSQPYSIHAMNHVIFRRAGEAELPPDLPITGKIIHLQLPPHLEDISSSRIRENVDLNRDISTFIDPVIQDFIYQNGLYLRDTQDKPLLYAGDLDFQWVESPSPQLLADLTAGQPDREVLRQAMSRHGDQVLLLRRTAPQQQLLGYVSYRLLSTSQLFDALEDNELANRVRLRSAGNVVLITSLAADTTHRHKDYHQLLLSELLARRWNRSTYTPSSAPTTAALPLDGGDPGPFRLCCPGGGRPHPGGGYAGSYGADPESGDRHSGAIVPQQPGFVRRTPGP